MRPTASRYFLPTAKQLPAAPHDTSASEAPTPGLGVGVMDQAVPFQRSARSLSPAAVCPSKLPTAAQCEVFAHETPYRAGELPWAGAGLGVVVSSHFEPFHRTANVRMSAEV